MLGHKYAEFDRTIQSLCALQWLSSGTDKDYEEFVASQNEPKLSRDSFQSLHKQLLGLEEACRDKGWRPKELYQALEAALVMGDSGKSQQCRDELATYNIDAPDHDDFYAELLKHPSAAEEKFPCFKRLSADAKALLRDTADIGHFGHMTHFEGGKEMFSKLKASDLAKKNPNGLLFAWLVHICDVAGALGHIDSKGAKTLNQATFDNMSLTIDACQRVVSDKKNEADACAHLLNLRQQMLEIPVDHPDKEILVRFCALLRITDKAQGAELVQAFEQLDGAIQVRARAFFSVAAADQLPQTPTYMPAVLVNLHKKTGDFEKTLKTGIPLFYDAFYQYYDAIGANQISTEIPLNFNELAGVVAQTDHLDPNKISIDLKTGQVRYDHPQAR